MIDNNVKNQNALQKTANEIRVAFLLSLLTNLYDIYHFLNTSGEVRQGMSILVGVLGTGLLWQFAVRPSSQVAGSQRSQFCCRRCSQEPAPADEVS